MRPPTKTMREALLRMLGNCGEIVRVRGGRWTTQNSRSRDWFATTVTMQAMERRGLVYVDEFAPVLDDDGWSRRAHVYRLTPSGFEEAERIKEVGT